MLELVSIIYMSLSFVGLGMLCLSFTKFGKTKEFYFVIGEIDFILAIFSMYLTAVTLNIFALVGVIFWFAAGSVNFFLATWPVTK